MQSTTGGVSIAAGVAAAALLPSTAIGAAAAAAGTSSHLVAGIRIGVHLWTQTVSVGADAVQPAGTAAGCMSKRVMHIFMRLSLTTFTRFFARRIDIPRLTRATSD